MIDKDLWPSNNQGYWHDTNKIPNYPLKIFESTIQLLQSSPQFRLVHHGPRAPVNMVTVSLLPVWVHRSDIWNIYQVHFYGLNNSHFCCDIRMVRFSPSNVVYDKMSRVLPTLTSDYYKTTQIAICLHTLHTPSFDIEIKVQRIIITKLFFSGYC